MIIHPPLPILIVDDSAVARQGVKAIVEVDRGFRALLAGDPYEAVEVMKRTIPAAILLDVNMPRMDGLTFLRKLRRQIQPPLPVLLVTDTPEKGIEGLELGASEVISKPRWQEPSEMESWGERLRDSLRLAIASVSSSPEAARIVAGNRYSADLILPPPSASSIRAMPADRDPIIAVGASTGGIQAIACLLHHLPADGPGLVIVQHNKPEFTTAFVQRLERDRQIRMSVREAHGGEAVRRGQVLVVGGDEHGVVRRVGSGYRVEKVGGPLISRFRPSVDVLFRSVAVAAGDRAVGIILTGMLDDGAQGLLEMHDVGAWTIAQDEATSSVFGMNREAIRRGAAREVLPLDQIAEAALKAAH